MMGPILIQKSKIQKFRLFLSLAFTGGLIFLYMQYSLDNPELSDQRKLTTAVALGAFVLVHILTLGNKLRRRKDGTIQVYTQLGFFKLSRIKVPLEDITDIELGKDDKGMFVSIIRLNDGKFILVDRDSDQSKMKEVSQSVKLLISAPIEK